MRKSLLKFFSAPSGFTLAHGLIFLFAGVVYAIGAATRAGVPGMVFDAIREQFGFSASATAGIANAGVLGCIVFLAFSGMLIDRFGWKKSILAGIIFQVLGEYFVYSSSSLSSVYVGAFLNGGGRTIGYLTLLKFLDSEFEKKYFSLLIGGFYVFSYTGTLLGTAPFARAAEIYPWQQILAWCNWLTLACGSGIAAILALCKKTDRFPFPAFVSVPPSLSDPKPHFSLELFWKNIKKPRTFSAVYTAASGIAIYWGILVVAKKYLTDICGASADVLGVMNTIVMFEMVFGGMLSFLCGNSRKPFQIFGAVLVFLGCISLLFGAILSAVPPLPLAWIGFLSLGIGYGMTCVNIISVREYVPSRFSASAISLVNFCANIAMIGMTQLGGYLFDRFPGTQALQGSPIAYGILFALCSVLSGVAVFTAISLRERNFLKYRKKRKVGGAFRSGRGHARRGESYRKGKEGPKDSMKDCEDLH